MTKIMSPEELEQELRAIGAERYHDKHPFHKLLHGGKLNKGQVQAWALNRYYYQSTIPLKDAVVISRFRNRNIWLQKDGTWTIPGFLIPDLDWREIHPH